MVSVNNLLIEKNGIWIVYVNYAYKLAKTIHISLAVSLLKGGNYNNNVHLSSAHQRPDR